MSIHYDDTAKKDPKGSGGWILLTIAIICVAVISFPEASRSLQAMVPWVKPLPGF